MVNVCISIGIEQNVSSLKMLSSKAYHSLSPEILGYYRLGAISTAKGILRNYRRVKRKNPSAAFPCARKLMLTSCYGFKIVNGFLRLPVRPGRHFHLKLNNHTMRVLSGMKLRSITVTPDSFSVSYSQEIVESKPKGYIGVDRNLDNATIGTTMIHE